VETQAPKFLEVEIKWLGTFKKVRLPQAEVQPEDDVVGYVLAEIGSTVVEVGATVNTIHNKIAYVIAYRPKDNKVLSYLLSDDENYTWFWDLPREDSGAWVPLDELYKYADFGEEILEAIFGDVRAQLDQEHWEIVKARDAAIQATVKVLRRAELPVDIKILETPSKTEITVVGEKREDTITITPINTFLVLPNGDWFNAESEQVFMNGQLYAIKLLGEYDFVKAFRVGNSHVVAVPFQGPAVRCRCGQLVIFKPL